MLLRCCLAAAQRATSRQHEAGHRAHSFTVSDRGQEWVLLPGFSGRGDLADDDLHLFAHSVTAHCRHAPVGRTELHCNRAHELPVLYPNRAPALPGSVLGSLASRLPGAAAFLQPASMPDAPPATLPTCDARIHRRAAFGHHQHVGVPSHLELHVGRHVGQQTVGRSCPRPPRPCTSPRFASSWR